MLALATAAIVGSMAMPFGLFRALSMPRRWLRPQPPPQRAASRRAPLAEHAWEDNVLRNLTVAREVRGCVPWSRS